MIKTVRSYLLPLCLIGASLFLITKGIAIKKDVAEIQAKILAEAKKAVPSTEEAHKGLDPMETIMVKSLFELLASKYGIPATVTENGGSFKISATKELLTDYDLTIGWLAAIDAVPFARMHVRELCVGIDCPGGVEVTVDFGPAAKTGKAAGGKQRGDRQSPTGDAASADGKQPAPTSTPVSVNAK